MSPDHHPARLVLQHEADELHLTLSGDWVRGAALPSLQPLTQALSRPPPPAAVRLIDAGLGRWDSRLLSFVLRVVDRCRDVGIEPDLSVLPSGVRGLLELAQAVPERAGARRAARSEPLLARLGAGAIARWTEGRELVVFVGEVTLALGQALRGRARFRGQDLLRMLHDCGPAALPIVTLIALLVGLILAFVGAVQLSLFGAQLYIADLVAIGMLREMGALMTAVIMSGRTGAAYAAQLGTMNVNSEIDALRTMGISPIEFLVLPRMVALALMMPLMCLYADLVGMIGGALVTIGMFDVSAAEYLHQTGMAAKLVDLGIGVFKGFVFGVLIGLAGCLQGIRCGQSASAVGDAATRAVVASIVFIVVADSVMTLICNRLDI